MLVIVVTARPEPEFTRKQAKVTVEEMTDEEGAENRIGRLNRLSHDRLSHEQ